MLADARQNRRAFERLVDEPSISSRYEETRAGRWLRENGMTARQVLERLSPAHFTAFVVYAGLAYPMMNVLLRFPSSGARTALRVQVKGLIDAHLDPSQSTPPPLTPVLGEHPAIRALLGTPPRDMTPEDLSRTRKRLY
ncbi:hypothetical protein, partial [Streptomyces sp. 4F14]|uniref:hypothetical protein n=1 Tax=Streptomyces sp. 4F14 TaxID=3394380 RepID=UPI003A881642